VRTELVDVSLVRDASPKDADDMPERAPSCRTQSHAPSLPRSFELQRTILHSEDRSRIASALPWCSGISRRPHVGIRIRKLGIWIVVLSLGAVAACSGGGGGGGGDDDDDDDDGSGDMAVPVTVTMTAPIGVDATTGNICQNFAVGGGISYSLIAGSECTGGEEYLLFLRDVNGVYAVTAGAILDPAGPVEILTTSVGTVTQEGGSGADQVAGLGSGANITIGTTDHPTVTFSFAANDVTVTAFE
jgi:hypothetical protein